MKNRYLLSLMTLLIWNLGLTTRMVVAGSEAEHITMQQKYSLDENWKCAELEKEIDQTEQEILFAQKELDALKEENDELERQLRWACDNARDLALHGSYQEITVARENCTIKEQIIAQKKAEVAEAQTKLYAKEEKRVQQVDEYHRLILSAAEKNLPAYIEFIKKSKQQLFENNKEAWASLDYEMLKTICLNLTPNYHLRDSDERVYYFGFLGGREVRYKPLFAGWSAHCPFLDKSLKKVERNTPQYIYNDQAFATAQPSQVLPDRAEKLDDIWRSTYVEPTWNNLNMSQKMSQSSLKSYTYPAFKAEVELVKNVDYAFKSHGDYDITPLITVLSLPIWGPFAAAGFAILLPSVPLHLTEASLRFAVQEAICRGSKLQKKLGIV